VKLTANTAPVIRRADDSDYQNLTMVLTAAFLHGDFAPYLIPDLTERSVRYYPYFELIADHALTHGHVDLIMDEQSAMPAAAATWYAIDNGRLPADPPDYDAHLAAAVGPALPRFFALDQTMHQRHPRDRDHDYLGHLAVQPGLQGKGLGSRLLEHHHQQLDTTGRYAYLEATGERNARLYERHGYQALEPYPIAPDSPLLYPMWRPGKDTR
jgi:GNAT superfamily N-acetyltransferase